MIIELFGCPGCGKTYLIHELTGETNTVAMSNNRLKNVLIRLIKKASLYTPESRILYRKLSDCVKGQNHKGIYISRSVECFLKNIVLLAFGYKHIKKDMYMAEGLVHRVVSTAVNFSWNSEIVESLIDTLSDYMTNVVPIYLDVDQITCFQSIRARNRHENDMDELSDKDLVKFLESYKVLFDCIVKSKSYLTVTRDDYYKIRELTK